MTFSDRMTYETKKNMFGYPDISQSNFLRQWMYLFLTLCYLFLTLRSQQLRRRTAYVLWLRRPPKQIDSLTCISNFSEFFLSDIESLIISIFRFWNVTKHIQPLKVTEINEKQFIFILEYYTSFLYFLVKIIILME